MLSGLNCVDLFVVHFDCRVRALTELGLFREVAPRLLHVNLAALQVNVLGLENELSRAKTTKYDRLAAFFNTQAADRHLLDKSLVADFQTLPLARSDVIHRPA